MSLAENKYKNLISNTLVFGISTFGSKVLVLLLQPVYTRYLATEQSSQVDIITSTCNFILPIMYLCISEAVIRFCLEQAYKKKDIFSTGFFTVLIGYGVLWLLYPVISRLPDVGGYVWLVYLYVLTSAMRTLITQFVRGLGLVRLFAMDGIFTTVIQIVSIVLLLVVFDMGVTGYVLATIVADGISALCLFFTLRLYRYLKVQGIDHNTRREMFHYAMPLIPNAVFWWVTNLSDRYFVRHMVSQHVNGLYGKSYLIPTAITLVSAIFTRAWELSAFSEYDSKAGARFFSNVFRSYYTVIFVAASGLILLIKPIIRVWLHPSYYDAWQYVPFLVLAVSFSCFVTFLGAVYNAAKKNIMVSITTFVGAVVNVILNALLIPRMGAQGAAVATFVSYFTVFVIRAVDTRRYVDIHMQPIRIGMNLALLLAQSVIAITEVRLWVLWECLIFLILVVCNFGYILFLLQRLLSMLPGRRRAGGGAR